MKRAMPKVSISKSHAGRKTATTVKASSGKAIVTAKRITRKK